jgi:hypothetical protein
VVQLHRVRERIEDAGATLHVIGNGPPMFMAGFRETTGYDGALYTDPSLAVYRALELRRGARTVLSARAAWNAVRALRGGFRQGRIQGDATQQGGVLVVGTDGAIRYRHADRVAGDHAPLAAVLAALCA